MKCGSETRVQEVDKHNPGVIDEIREMKYIKEAAQWVLHVWLSA